MSSSKAHARETGSANFPPPRGEPHISVRQIAKPNEITVVGVRSLVSSHRITRALGWALVTASIAVLLLGCATVEPVSISAHDSAARFRSRNLADEGLRAFATQSNTGFSTWPPGKWSARALDLAALYFSPQFEVSRARWRVAQAGIVTAGQFPNPTISVSPQYVTTATAGVSPWVIGASLVQIIDAGGKRPARLAQARYLAESARLESLNTAWNVIGQVNRALLDVGIARRRIGALDRVVEAQKALVEIAETRLGAGLGSRLELTTARNVLNRALLDRQAAESALIDAHYRLAEAVGIPASSIPISRLAATVPTAALGRKFRVAIRREAVLNRADLLARLADFAASDVALRLELARQYPNVELGPSYEFDQGDSKWGLSLNLTIPILNQNQGAIGEAVARRQQAADTFVALQAQVIGDVDRAIAVYQSAADALRVANNLLQQQRQLAQDQEQLFSRGETNRLELLAARAELANAELAQLDAAANLAKARLAVEIAGQRSLEGFDLNPFLGQK